MCLLHIVWTEKRPKSQVRWYMGKYSNPDEQVHTDQRLKYLRVRVWVMPPGKTRDQKRFQLMVRDIWNE